MINSQKFRVKSWVSCSFYRGEQSLEHLEEPEVGHIAPENGYPYCFTWDSPGEPSTIDVLYAVFVLGVSLLQKSGESIGSKVFKLVPVDGYYSFMV